MHSNAPRAKFVIFLVCLCRHITMAQRTMLRISGDFTIGAMFPIHSSTTTNDQCGNVINDQAGIQNLEAFLFSLDKANTDILSDTKKTLGAIAVDTCYSETVALDNALEFIKLQSNSLGLDLERYLCQDDHAPIVSNSDGIIGVIGAATSDVSIQLAHFFRLFHITQISYSATSPELSDTAKYNYFMRTVPSDEYQAKVIVEVLKTLQWMYVTVIYEGTSYGENGYVYIKKESERNGICIGEAFKIRRNFESNEDMNSELNNVVNNLLKYTNTDGQIIVIAFANEEIVYGIMSVVAQRGITHIKWVGGDAWTGRKVNTDVQSTALSSLGVQPVIKNVPAFDEYFQGLKISTNSRNPWFAEYWKQLFNCTSSQSGKNQTCVGNMQNLTETRGTYNKYYNTYVVMDAVYAYAHAIRSWYMAKCQEVEGPCEMKNTTELKPYLQNVSFTGLADLNFKFYGNSGPARYSIMQYVNASTGPSWIEIGKFMENSDSVSWNNKLETFKSYQLSFCSKKCTLGAAELRNGTCCWTCLQCTAYQILQGQSCSDCPDGQQADTTYTKCVQIMETNMEIQNAWAIFSIIMASLGVVITIIVAVIFFWQRETPIIMASGKELSFVLLLGILLSYCSSFSFVAYPTSASCGTTRVLLGLSFTICYAAILVKTNRIYRVFNIETSKPKKLKFINAKSQLMITFAFVSLELAALTSWLIYEPPTSVNVYQTRSENVRVCKDALHYTYLTVLMYPFLLMVASVYYAIRTRKTPNGFNEAQHITFGCYAFLLLWVAFTIIYFTVKNNTIKIVALCFACTMNATVTLVTLFVTKVYVVLFKPQKNTREQVMIRKRAHVYESVNISNASRMAISASTWNIIQRTSASGNFTGNLTKQNESENRLSINVISGDSPNYAECSLHFSPCTEHLDRVGVTEEEVLGITPKTQFQIDTDHLDYILQKNGSHSPTCEINGLKPFMPFRRSLKSFSSRKKRHFNVQRTVSANIVKLDIPEIIITDSTPDEPLSKK